jgi:HD-GYP domain-containing protein (c-di-GMP phosphodiesterase class II)
MLELSNIKILCIAKDHFFDEFSKDLERTGYNVEVLKAFPKMDHIRSNKTDAILIKDSNEEKTIFLKKFENESDLIDPVLITFDDNFNDLSITDRIDEIVSPKIDISVLREKIKYNLQIRSLRNSLVKSEFKLNNSTKYAKFYKKEYIGLKKESSKNHDFLHNSLQQISLMVTDKEILEKELNQSNILYKNNFDNFVNLLSSLIEAKRQYHKGHSKKVAEISVFIGKSLELTDEEVKQIEIASLLHELGKLSIPDELSLKNPKEYSPHEEALLVQHPVAGANMLTDFSGFDMVEKIIRHFHENVDGTGHPEGLKRSRIPMGSRIISAANIYDNLVYRNNYSVKNAFAVIEESIGIKYDSKVINQLHKYANLNPVLEDDRSNEINIYEIKPGMKLASGIFTPLGAKLLPVDSVLSQKDIDKIANYHKLTPLDETVYIKE